LKIAIDTPKEIIDTLRLIDVAKIDKAKLAKWLTTAKESIGMFVARRTVKPEMMELNIPGLPTEIVVLLNNYDFSKLKGMKRAIYLATANNWISKNLPMREYK